MKFKLQAIKFANIVNEKADANIILLSTNFKPNEDQLSLFLQKLKKSADFKWEEAELLQSYGLSDTALKHLVIVGVKNEAKSIANGVKQAWSAIAKFPIKTANIILVGLDWQADSIQLAVRQTDSEHYLYTNTKTDKSLPKKLSALKEVTLMSEQTKLLALNDELEKAQALISGITITKLVGDLPANYATPRYLAETAKKIAKQPKLSCEVLDEKAIKDLKMGAFLGVAQGSDEPPRLIVLKYNGAAKNQAPYVLVGKGITFDAGGISLKPAGDMDQMKFDMCGAGSVLGVFEALAKYQPKINVIGVIASCENLPSGKALKPSDVITSMSGQTIEILNTDAEGRLVLCDALTYALQFKPKVIIDIATLTGACVVALGDIRCGMYANDDTLALQLQQAGEQSQDLCWRMPLDDAYESSMLSNFADVANANVANRSAGSVTAAKFLQRFVGDTTWAHLDVAGVAWLGGKAKGATGRPVSLLFNFLLNQIDHKVAKTTPKTKKATGGTKTTLPSKN